MSGIFALMLHSHIPYCRKSGVWPAGEEWLFEAMNETYIPLLRVLRALHFDGIRSGIMIGVVPVLMEQLADAYMKEHFQQYMEDKIYRAEGDVSRFGDDPERMTIARYWLDFFRENYRAYRDDFYCDIPGTLKWLQEEGDIEVLTSGATHGFLPLMEQDSAIFSQVRVGIETYERYFGCHPRGFWLPECAYRPEQWSAEEGRMRCALDEWLAREGIRYFFVESVGITGASFSENRHDEVHPSTLSGYRLPSGCTVFGRNEATGRQVWSPGEGYPGDKNYLEFHQKDAVSGLHYWRVTGKPEKELYNPVIAKQSVEKDAQHFVALLADLSINTHMPETDRLIVSPYDCELFGHWWHEGVMWLDRVCRLLAYRQDIISQPLGEYLEAHEKDLSTIKMKASTWGLNSNFTVWQNPEHGWIWPYINSCAKEAEEILAHTATFDDRSERIFKQMCRELLLMEGSDWPFLLFTAQAKEYANQRFHHHHQRFRKLIWAAKDLYDNGRLSEGELSEMEDIDSPWPGLDYTLFRRQEAQPCVLQNKLPMKHENTRIE